MTSETRPTLFSEKPYVAVVSEDYFEHQKICFSCFKLAPRTLRCAKCHLVWYCSVDCQTKDWKTGQHLRECKVFASIPESEHFILKANETLRLVARVLARKDKDDGLTDDSELVTDIQLKPRKLSDLYSNAENISGATFQRAWKVFGHLFGSRSKFFAGTNEDTFRQVFGVVQTNSFGIFDYDVLEGQLSLGRGLYLQCSLFDHSCDPDLGRYLEGSTRHIRLLKPIDLTQTDFDSLKISYRHAFGSGVSLTRERRVELERSLYFMCECGLCQNEKLDRGKECSVVGKCPQCQENLVVTMEGEPQFECLHCGKKVAGDGEDAIVARALIHKMRNIFDNEAHGEKIQEDPFSFIQKAAQLLDSVKNIWLLRLREEALVQEWEIFKYSQGAIKSYKQLCETVPQVVATYRFYGVDSSFFPTICAKFAQVHADSGDKVQAKKWYEEAQELWANVVCSPGHHCVTDIKAKIDGLA